MKRILAASLALNILFLAMAGAYLFRRIRIGKKLVAQRVSSYDSRNELLASYPIQKGDVVFAGDSHVQFNEWVEMLGHPNILNRGIGGESTEQLSRRMGSIALKHPEKIIIIAGSNDLMSGVKTHETLRNYERMLSVIRKESPGTEVYVCAIFPTIWEPAREISELNDGIRRLTRKYGYTFLDTFTPLLSKDTINPALTWDGIHLNAKGYQTIKPLFLSVLEGKGKAR